jgi:hypothetical protein
MITDYFIGKWSFINSVQSSIILFGTPVKYQKTRYIFGGRANLSGRSRSKKASGRFALAQGCRLPEVRQSKKCQAIGRRLYGRGLVSLPIMSKEIYRPCRYDVWAITHPTSQVAVGARVDHFNPQTGPTGNGFVAPQTARDYLPFGASFSCSMEPIRS